MTGALVPSQSGRIRRILIGERIIALCDEHAAEAQMNDPQNVDEMRELFSEPEGRRSLLPRRAVLDRRVFPPRPEGRRRGDGRRASDPAE